MKKLSIISIKEQKNSDVWEHDTSESENNTIRQLKYASWKYKNPYSVSISNCTSENIKEDEPQEGRKERNILFSCREYLASYQESCGTPRTEYSFAALIIVMAQTAARPLWALLCVLLNILPIIQMFSFILRFILDKVINIQRTMDLQQITVKFAIFTMQLLSISVCLIFILGFIVFPIIQMTIQIAINLVMYC